MGESSPSQNKHLIRTRFTELTHCLVPIQQAEMGDIANPHLAAAVSNAGALGMVSVTGISDEPQRVEKWLDETRKLTKGVFGVKYEWSSVQSYSNQTAQPASAF